jgi:hypothetical protein
MSGMMAGHLVAVAIHQDGKAASADAAAAYHDWLAGWFTTDAAQLTRLYRQLREYWS